MEPSAKKRLQRGEEILITAHDKPIARLSAIDEPTDRPTRSARSGRFGPTTEEPATPASRPTYQGEGFCE